MSEFWSRAKTIFGWIIAAVLSLTAMFIIIMTGLDGVWGFIISIFLSIYYALPVLVLSGVMYGVAYVIIEEKTNTPVDSGQRQ